MELRTDASLTTSLPPSPETSLAHTSRLQTGDGELGCWAGGPWSPETGCGGVHCAPDRSQPQAPCLGDTRTRTPCALEPWPGG